MGFAFQPTCCCNGCLWFQWAEPAQAASVFNSQVSILEGSYWNTSGPYVRWQGSVSGGSTGRVLLNGSASTYEYALTITFAAMPSGDDDTIVRIYLDCGSTPGSHWVELRTGGQGHITVTGSTGKELLYPFNPDTGATLTACIQQEPNSSGQYFLTCTFFDAVEGPGDAASVVSDALTPTHKQAIIEITSTGDVLIESVFGENHANGTATCEDCVQDCGCPNCTLQVEITGIENASAGYDCAISPGGPGPNGQVCAQAIGYFFLPSSKGVYTARRITEPDEGPTRCIWWNCFPLLVNNTPCSLVIAVSMVYDPVSGDTTIHGGVYLLNSTCSACTATNPCQYDPEDGWDTPCCTCSSMYFKQVINDGGGRQECATLVNNTLSQVTSEDSVFSTVVNGECCNLSGTTLTIINSINDCGQSTDHPLAEVFGDGNSVANHSTTPTTANGTDFGMIQVGGSASTTFTITNAGSQDLHISGVSISGSSDFRITANVGTNTILPGTSTTFTVAFAPSTPTVDCGSEIAWIDFSNDDPRNNPFWFEVRGESTSGVIEVTDGSGNVISNGGGNSPELTNHTDFGTVALGSGSSYTYTIKNTGSNDLALGVVGLSGAAPGDFQITAQPGSTLLAPSATTTFTVEFEPLLSGTRTATVSIPNSDCAVANPFTFNVQGVGSGTDPGEPPACPFSGKTASISVGSFDGVTCVGCDGTYSGIPLTDSGDEYGDCHYCVFSDVLGLGDCAYTIFVRIFYCYDADDNPATYIDAGFTTYGPYLGYGDDFGWNSPGPLVGTVGSSPLIVSGWLTTITGLSLGSPNFISVDGGPSICDPSNITAVLTIS